MSFMCACVRVLMVVLLLVGGERAAGVKRVFLRSSKAISKESDHYVDLALCFHAGVHPI